MWTASTLVMMAMSGRTMRVSGVISPAWFMPISKTPNWLDAGMRASVSGTPMWLLKLFGGAWVRPSRARTWASASLVEVLPMEPVTARIFAAVRARATMPAFSSAFSGSATTI